MCIRMYKKLLYTNVSRDISMQKTATTSKLKLLWKTTLSTSTNILWVEWWSCLETTKEIK
jgi:hypothetical protein